MYYATLSENWFLIKESTKLARNKNAAIEKVKMMWAGFKISSVIPWIAPTSVIRTAPFFKNEMVVSSKRSLSLKFLANCFNLIRPYVRSVLPATKVRTKALTPPHAS